MTVTAHPPTLAPFAQGGPADVLPPGWLLGSLTETALHRADSLSDDELTGVIQAGRPVRKPKDSQSCVRRPQREAESANPTRVESRNVATY